MEGRLSEVPLFSLALHYPQENASTATSLLISLRHSKVGERAATLFLMRVGSYRTAAHLPTAIHCCFWMVLTTAGCITPEESFHNADLIALPDGSFGGPDAYCDTTGAPQLRIVIQNQGQAGAPSSITRVRFSPGGTVDIPTAPLQSAQRRALDPIPIPAACFDPDCDFTITVDARGQIDETIGEENNLIDGRCSRP
jgi:hypothetical protein